MNDNKKKQSRKIPLPIFLLAGMVLLSGMATGFYAKYVHQESETDSMTAQSFYFTSDLLTEEGATYTLSPNTTEITVKLRNYEDELRWSDTDISYNYTTEVKGAEPQSGSGTISHNDNAGQEHSFTIEGLNAGTYTITVTSTKPYKKTLTGTFTIPEEKTNIYYTVDDNSGSPYAQLTVWTDNYDGDITISWPAGVVPDTTEGTISAATYGSGSYVGGSATVDSEKYSSCTYRFFKTDTNEDYTNSIKATKSE